MKPAGTTGKRKPAGSFCASCARSGQQEADQDCLHNQEKKSGGSHFFVPEDTQRYQKNSGKFDPGKPTEYNEIKQDSRQKLACQQKDGGLKHLHPAQSHDREDKSDDSEGAAGVQIDRDFGTCLQVGPKIRRKEQKGKRQNAGHHIVDQRAVPGAQFLGGAVIDHLGDDRSASI